MLTFDKQNQSIMYTLNENQYIPRKAKTLPSGFPACATYYYITNDKDQVISRKTLKPYRGKEMDNYAFHDKEYAEHFVKGLNNPLIVILNK